MNNKFQIALKGDLSRAFFLYRSRRIHGFKYEGK